MAQWQIRGVLALAAALVGAWLLLYARWMRRRSTLLSHHAGTAADVQVACINGGAVGPAIVILHGGVGGYDQALEIAQSFAQPPSGAPRRVIALSRPGYLGTALRNDTASLDGQAVAIRTALTALAVKDYVLVGWSAGVEVALTLALRDPAAIRALILESPGLHPNFTEGAWLSLANSALLFAAINTGQKFLLPRAWTGLVFSGDSERVSPSRVDYVVAHQQTALVRFMQTFLPYGPRKAGTLNDVRNATAFWASGALAAFPFSRIAAPTLVVSSPDDASGWFPHAQQLARALPRGTLLRAEDAGHLIWFSPRAQQWQATANAWLDRILVAPPAPSLADTSPPALR